MKSCLPDLTAQVNRLGRWPRSEKWRQNKIVLVGIPTAWKIIMNPTNCIAKRGHTCARVRF